MNNPRKNDHRASSFRKTDVTRALKAAMAAGIANPVVKVDPKTKEITITGGERPATGATNPWDEVLTDAADKERPT
jgi:hypothetical protein